MLFSAGHSCSIRIRLTLNHSYDILVLQIAVFVFHIYVVRSRMSSHLLQEAVHTFVLNAALGLVLPYCGFLAPYFVAAGVVAVIR